MPGGSVTSPGLAGTLPALPGNLRKQLKGAPMPAPHHILCAAVEGARALPEAQGAVVRGCEVDLRAEGHDPRRIDGRMALVIVPLDVQQVHGRRDAR